MTRENLGLALWRWSAAGMGLASLATALVASALNAPGLGSCLHPATVAGLGHCPLCWAAAIILVVAGAPSPRFVPTAKIRQAAPR